MGISTISFLGIWVYCMYLGMGEANLPNKILLTFIAVVSGVGGAVFGWVSYRWAIDIKNSKVKKQRS